MRTESIQKYSEADEMRDMLGGTMGRMMMKEMSDSDMKKMKGEIMRAMMKKAKNHK